MSSLVTILSGSAMPQPVMRMPVTWTGPGPDGMDADKADIAFDDAARVDGQSQAGPADLACPGTSTDLRGELDHLGQPGGPERMPPSDQSATRVHHETGAVHPGEAGFGGRAGLSRPEEPERLEGEDLLGCGGIVQLDQIEVVGTEAPGFPCGLGGLGRGDRGSRAVHFRSGPPNR